MSLRINTIASLITKNAKVIDIGTDHAYLPIYLYQNNITHDITATDISKNVLEYSKKNLEKHNLLNKISLKESDGFKNITDTFDVAVIAGMGTSTIKHILDTKKLPDTLIIETHNDYYELRCFLNKIGYKIAKEIVVKDNNKYYPIIKYIKGLDNLSKEELLFGKSNNKEYFLYLKEKYNDVYQKSKQDKYLEYVNILDGIIEKIPD